MSKASSFTPVTATWGVLRAQLAACALILPGAMALAQSPSGSYSARVPDTHAPVQQMETSPTWKSLTAVQREALAPLAPVWGEISSNRKGKWIALSANYRSLSPHEQATLHGRMKEWASLSSTERNRARMNYALARDLSHDEKKAQWEAYQALSPEQKKQFVAKAGTQATGAAPAVTKTNAGKLAAVPVTRSELPSHASAAQRAKTPASGTTP